MILCCGEALIDMIPTPTVSGQEGYVPHVGGSVFNTAIALGRLGVRAGMLTGMSRDIFGLKLSDALRANQVDTTHVIASGRPTTLAFVHLSEGQATYSFFDENSAGRMLAPEDLPPISPDISSLYFGGISLACEPCADTYATLLASEGQNRAVMIDPNIRPGFIGDEERFRLRLNGMLSMADIVKVSDDDLNWLYPDAAPTTARARTLLEHGPSVVVLTRGSHGATAFLRGGADISISAEKSNVVDTVGAGDTFNAGILAKLSEFGLLTKPALRDLPRDALAKALSYGARVAAVTVSRAGANPPWASEV